MSGYEQQQRGDISAYDRYLRGMDSSMKQKIALTAAHLLASGKVADMGMGSGSGSQALAALYPALEVVGVDINPTMVALASERFTLPNLSFACGDIAAMCFPEASLDAVFDSSVLHHVTTFSGYDHDAAGRALETQARQLRPHGMLIVRDFLDPGDGIVDLEIPADDGDDTDDPRTCSTASLFLRFGREFRKLSPAPGFEIRETASTRAGFRRYRLSKKLAAEFVLRKDYRTDWETEILEEYTYFTQLQFEERFSRIGIRILASSPLWNPWIVRHRYEGKIFLFDEAGQELEYPATNYLIAGEKVEQGESVRFEESSPAAPLGFLTMDYHRDRRTGAVMDLVRRPHATIDVIPWFSASEEIFVIARKSYPRPILSYNAEPALDGSTPAHYVTEPLNVLQHERPLGSTVVELLATAAAIPANRIRAFRTGCVYYPSPGGVEEEVRSALVEVEPAFEQKRIECGSGFTTSGHVRAIEATQILRAAHVGGLTDARLELNCYYLLQTLGRSAGPWIGDRIEIEDRETEGTTSTIEELIRRPARRVFEPAPAAESRAFLDLRCSLFRELDSQGIVCAEKALELVVPRTLSINSVVIALLARQKGTIVIGVDDDDLPAAESFNGNSQILVAPAWRLPRTITAHRSARAWIGERLLREYGLRARHWWVLGGKYHPSPGVTPERVEPFAVEVERAGDAERTILWVPLAEIVRTPELLIDGHLRIVAFRSAHALGLL